MQIDQENVNVLGRWVNVRIEKIIRFVLVPLAGLVISYSIPPSSEAQTYRNQYGKKTGTFKNGTFRNKYGQKTGTFK